MSETEVKNLRISSLGIANRIMQVCASKSLQDITNMKVQKLLYYVYAYFYLKHNKVLFGCEHIMFWQFGPVITRVYDSLKHHKANHIQEYIYDTHPYDEDGNANETYRIIDIKDHANYEIAFNAIEEIVTKLGMLSANELKNLSHKDTSAWYTITDNGQNTYQTLTSDKLFLVTAEIENITSKYNIC
jgi:uncharacterized phage-associated protein